MFQNNFELKLHKEKKYQSGNLLGLDITINGNRFTLINLYGPNSDCPEFYENVVDIINEFDNLYTVICGDFNIALNYNLDTFNYSHINNPHAREKVLQMMGELDLNDYFRILYPDKKYYTWHKRSPVKGRGGLYKATGNFFCHYLSDCSRVHIAYSYLIGFPFPLSN